MKYLLRLVQSARPYWWLLVITGISLLAITALNLTAPQLVMRLTTILTHAPHAGSIVQIRNIALLLVLIYVARALFRFSQLFKPCGRLAPGSRYAGQGLRPPAETVNEILSTNRPENSCPGPQTTRQPLKSLCPCRADLVANILVLRE